MDMEGSNAQLKLVIPIIAGLLGYLIYWLTQESSGLKKRLERKYGDKKASIRRIVFSKYLGGITVGLFPYGVYTIVFPEASTNKIGFFFNTDTAMASLLWIAGLWLVILPVIVISSRSNRVLAKQPEIRISEWKWKLVASNFLAWSVYLLGYELFFRGIMLFPLVNTIGIWPAIAVNIIFYAGVHIPKGTDEVLGAIPLAIVLSLLTIKTGTIWVAYFVHLAMAWTVTLSAIKNHREMKIVKFSSDK